MFSRMTLNSLKYLNEVTNIMAAMDEFREEREKIKNGTLKEKLSYFWFYYKVHTIVAVCSIIMITSFVVSIVTQKDEVFYAAFLNSETETDNAAFMEEFTELLGVDTQKYTTYVDTSMAITTDVYTTSTSAVEKFMAFNSSNVIDVLVGTEDIFKYYADDGAFYNLEEVLSEEQLEKYADYIYYTKDAEGNTYPAGILIEDSAILDRYGYYPDQTIYFGVMSTTKRLEYSAMFLDFLMESE